MLYDDDMLIASVILVAVLIIWGWFTHKKAIYPDIRRWRRAMGGLGETIKNSKEKEK